MPEKHTPAHAANRRSVVNALRCLLVARALIHIAVI